MGGGGIFIELNAFHRNHAQFDYFSSNYQQFQEDFYHYSNLRFPLSFIEEDILRVMAAGGINYFRLPANHSIDQETHIFVFEVFTDPQQPYLRIFKYAYHYCDTK